MEDRKDKQIVQQVFDSSLSGIQDDPWMAQRVLNNASRTKERGGITIRKRTIIPVILMILLLLGTVAYAATVLLNSMFESVIDMEIDQGAFCSWSLDEKIALIDLLSENGWDFSTADIDTLHSEQTPIETKEKLATQMITEHFGREDAISHFDIIEKVKGPMSTWSLEDKAWYSSYIRTKKTMIDSWQDVLPGKDDLSTVEIIEIAKKAILDAHSITERELDDRIVSVDFFITDKHPEPRWRVAWLRDPYGMSEYTVLITRKGEITEDPDLEIYTPEYMAHLIQNPQNKNYTVDNSYPRGRQEQWSILDKAKWLGEANGIPSEKEISEEAAVAIAQEALQKRGYDLTGYESSVWYKLYDYYDTSEDARQGPFYIVYFVDNFDAPMNTYAVFIDPNTGAVTEICTPEDTQSNG